tara:strand:+ start:15784 stop:16263 length:480 start_codon:yes stop_codon:yes gene_type:complete
MLEAVASHNPKHVKTEFFSILPEHNIVTVDLFGTWNEQHTMDYVTDFKRIVHRYFTQEWACIINLQHLDMLLSESFQVETFKALNAWSYIKGMKAISVIVSHRNRSHLLYQFEEIFKVNHPYATAVCHSELESTNWLAEQGFKQREKKPTGDFSHVVSA